MNVAYTFTRDQSVMRKSQWGCTKVYKNFFQKQPPEIYKEAVLKNFAICTGKHLFMSLFLTMLQVCRTESLLKSDSIRDVSL